MIADYLLFSKDNFGLVQYSAPGYCKRIRKLRETLLKTFERTRKLKSLLDQVDQDSRAGEDADLSSSVGDEANESA